MTVSIATEAVVEVPGIPENWLNRPRWNPIATRRAMHKWCENHGVWHLAQSARNRARWPLPVKTDPPAPRWLSFTLHKHPPLYDDDGAMASLKPVRDALIGVLLVDDSLAWCRCWSVAQVPTPKNLPERTIIRVGLVIPPEVAQ